jgi:uncharacterized protein YecT (DUF1311 family)
MLISLLIVAANPDTDSLCDSMVRNDLIVCAQRLVSEAEATLASTWASLPHDEYLRSAQKAWLKWRDAECAAQDFARDGREGGIRELSCRAELTQERAHQLDEAYGWMRP